MSQDRQEWMILFRLLLPFLIIFLIQWLRRTRSAEEIRESSASIEGPPLPPRAKGEVIAPVELERHETSEDLPETANWKADEAWVAQEPGLIGQRRAGSEVTSAQYQNRTEMETRRQKALDAERRARREQVWEGRAGQEAERRAYMGKPIPDEIARHMQEWLTGKFSGPDQSPLAYVGYHVGKTAGLSKWARQRRLEVCFRVQVPEKLMADYGDWGRPATVKRAKAMAAHLQRHADLRRSEVRYDQAVAEWDEDRAWVVRELGAKARGFAGGKV